ncbi:MAG: ribonuclease P, partial [Candidatus Caldarchaeum sp.]|nr:ribonuclease P [Candidatus Caldarchaeum sp.]
NEKLKRKVLRLVEKALDFAEKTYPTNPARAIEAVKLAVRMAQKKRTGLPPQLRRKFCRKCFTPFVGPSTFSVRVRQEASPHVVVRCRVCGNFRRYRIVKRRVELFA